jgi:hypothetical protein
MSMDRDELYNNIMEILDKYLLWVDGPATKSLFIDNLIDVNREKAIKLNDELEEIKKFSSKFLLTGGEAVFQFKTTYEITMDYKIDLRTLTKSVVLPKSLKFVKIPFKDIGAELKRQSISKKDNIILNLEKITYTIDDGIEYAISDYMNNILFNAQTYEGIELEILMNHFGATYNKQTEKIELTGNELKESLSSLTSASVYQLSKLIGNSLSAHYKLYKELYNANIPELTEARVIYNRVYKCVIQAYGNKNAELTNTDKKLCDDYSKSMCYLINTVREYEEKQGVLKRD